MTGLKKYQFRKFKSYQRPYIVCTEIHTVGGEVVDVGSGGNTVVLFKHFVFIRFRGFSRHRHCINRRRKQDIKSMGQTKDFKEWAESIRRNNRYCKVRTKLEIIEKLVYYKFGFYK